MEPYILSHTHHCLSITITGLASHWSTMLLSQAIPLFKVPWGGGDLGQLQTENIL